MLLIFATMIAFCTGYGADYQPSNAMISLASLNAALADAQAALDDVQAKMVPWKVGDFENIYTDVRRRTTHLLTAFKASGALTN
ncbi:MAG: hypothetical protein IPP63_09505 [Chloracidobacterium sp.]|nr:hypothetical protein [Chloracidobacterium sp.]